MALTKSVQKDISKSRIVITYATRSTTKIWNAMRGEGEPALFSGWYWAKGNTEGGPFRSESAAMRDAWYWVVKGHAPPPVNSTREMRALMRTNVTPLRAYG